ncbi:hypothetical protein SmJEL517_g06112 [Synchytrium microbalum]|uniref:Nudix hydrolase domain-containing protein n=1 Tax=Synchytrium microbalum TaxID=1806994 RepID=A0A507BSF9_9FUNG|nr:uncharacterized protein SmJEL517_g06112 [Synchytrium microbalum]TPX30301.1 hypothetical protein SmJEL517_g06112 [Synchytrium microbalum]
MIYRRLATSCVHRGYSSKAGKIVFDPETLATFAARLKSLPPTPRWHLKTDTPREAAILMPLCTVKDIPSVLFQVRQRKMRKHGGEVAFPGGSKDATDVSLEDTALRETMEEISLPSSSIQVLGTFQTVPDRTQTIMVTPFLGYCGELDPQTMTFNSDEVSEVFAVPLDFFLDSNNRGIQQFRGMGPAARWMYQEKYDIWGLTSYVLHNMLRLVIAPDTYPTL